MQVSLDYDGNNVVVNVGSFSVCCVPCRTLTYYDLAYFLCYNTIEGTENGLSNGFNVFLPSEPFAILHTPHAKVMIPFRCVQNALCEYVFVFVCLFIQSHICLGSCCLLFLLQLLCFMKSIYILVFGSLYNEAIRVPAFRTNIFFVIINGKSECKISFKPKENKSRRIK